jgi:two-component system response regulator AtoC
MRFAVLALRVQQQSGQISARDHEGSGMAVSEQTNHESAPEASGLPPEEIIFGRSPAMASIRRKVQKVLGTNIPILIQGENGTGKGLLAQYIHLRSTSSAGAFVKVNCAAIPGALLESELFGYEKGSFTDANTSKPGYVEMAHRGTLFLDEIADLDLSLQAKVLQLMQDAQFSRIGDERERHVETRVICATNRNLQGEIDAGRFRQDLFYRINVISINLPRLRERREDVVPLADFFLKQLNSRFERSAPPFPAAVIESFLHREWRGNIRELENLVAQYAILGSLDAGAMYPAKNPSAPPSHVTADGTIPLKRIAKQAIREIEGSLILRALREHKWNRRKAAQALNISYRALIYKIREAGLSHRVIRKTRQAHVPQDNASGLD